ncbi:hypothetical protein HDA40_001977 [Hamadaea flava]|uniref:Secreted protein n=1 Tax=Hamadaea flava TaxID=1742688 RepID=A0ABV8LXT0_9ACTN|nr:hypothetical protein [Hamadaea flava]MCP2323470.1 hypothetical protein [Hamadaea flava]
MRREISRAMVAALLLASLVSCSAAPAAGPAPRPTQASPARADPRLVVRLSGEAGVSFHDLPPGRPTSIGDLAICIDRPGSIRIDRVAAKDVFGSLTLDEFAAIPTISDGRFHPFENKHQAIAQYGIDTAADVVVSEVCTSKPGTQPAPTDRFAWLILQYTRQTAESAGNSGITIYYTSGTGQHADVAEWSVSLCEPSDHTTAGCE